MNSHSKTIEQRSNIEQSTSEGKRSWRKPAIKKLSIRVITQKDMRPGDGMHGTDS